MVSAPTTRPDWAQGPTSAAREVEAVMTWAHPAPDTRVRAVAAEAAGASLARTVAVSAMSPASVGVTEMWAMVEALTASVPRSQMTTPAALAQLPASAVAEAKATWGGRGSVRVTPVAGVDAVLATTTV